VVIGDKGMKILVASKNQGKIEGAKRAFLKYYDDIDIMGISVPSDVSEQPVNKDTYLGAKNRVRNLKKYANENNIDADMFVAVETGIHDCLGRWMITSIAVIEDKGNFESYGTSASFPVPDRFVDEIINSDLSQVVNKIFTEDDERRNGGGASQMLTHNVITRIDLTESAFIMALTKYINKNVWN
jgi:inosine/xanthosine triphosphatase